MQRVIRALVIGASTLALAGCGASSDPPESHPTDARLMVVDDPLGNASLADVARASDAVLVGTVVSREEGIQLGSGPGALPYTAFDIQSTRVIKGVSRPEVRVFMITQDPEGRPVEIEGRPHPTDGEAVWLLTEIAPEFNRPGDYVLTSISGVLPAAKGRIAVDHSEVPAVREAIALGTVDKITEFLSARP